MGVALIDLTTGEFSTTEYSGADGAGRPLKTSCACFAPRELVVADRRRPGGPARIGAARRATDARRAMAVRSRRAPGGPWSSSCRTRGLEGFGLDGHEPRDRRRRRAGRVPARTPRRRTSRTSARSASASRRADLLIDPDTLKHLEILEGSDGGRVGSLLDEIDQTITPMGGRLLRSWLVRPLVALEAIRDRLDAVEELAFRGVERAQAARRAQGRARPRAPRGARRAGHRRAARSRRAQAIARRGAARAHGARRPAGAAGREPGRPRSTTCRRIANGASSRRWSTSRRALARDGGIDSRRRRSRARRPARTSADRASR